MESKIPGDTITLKPSSAIAQICSTIKMRECDLDLIFPKDTTVKEVLELLLAAGFDGLVTFSPPQAEKAKERMRMLAEKGMNLPVRGSYPVNATAAAASGLPSSPRPASPPTTRPRPCLMALLVFSLAICLALMIALIFDMVFLRDCKFPPQQA